MIDNRSFQPPSGDTSMPERLDEEVRRKGIIRGVPLFHFYLSLGEFKKNDREVKSKKDKLIAHFITQKGSKK